MSFFSQIGSTLSASFSELFASFVAFIPGLIAALIILLVGLLIAGAISKLVSRVIELSKIDSMVAKVPAVQKLNTSGANISLSSVVGWLVKWFLVVATLIAVADILKLTQFNSFLVSIAEYIPSVVVAVLILTAGIVLGNGVADVIRKVLKSSELGVGGIVATIAQWAIVIFSIMTALTQLNIAVGLIQTLFTGIVFMLALAGGLAFGLGGKDAAGSFVNDIRSQMKH